MLFSNLKFSTVARDDLLLCCGAFKKALPPDSILGGRCKLLGNGVFSSISCLSFEDDCDVHRSFVVDVGLKVAKLHLRSPFGEGRVQASSCTNELNFKHEKV